MSWPNNQETSEILTRLLEKIEQDAQIAGLSQLDTQQLKKDCTKAFSRKPASLFPFAILAEK